ncbi:MAG: hypothetical protein HS111_01375 [Kofleriaceae bacterium]|nr:hypothetical protein [Kofleriaceae bacterium]
MRPGIPRLRRRLAYRLVQRAIALANRFGVGGASATRRSRATTCTCSSRSTASAR